MSKKRLHLIYIPGLGDHNISGQLKAVKSWRYWGVDAELLQMKWADGEKFGPKLDRILKRIDELTASGKTVGLVGASAGAGAVINAFAARKNVIVGVVLIAGKVNRPASIGASYRSKHPAFVDSAQHAPQSLQSLTSADKQRILSIYAVADETVYKPDSRVAGAHNRIAPTIGHFFTIATQLSLGAPFFIRFLKKLHKLDHD